MTVLSASVFKKKRTGSRKQEGKNLQDGKVHISMYCIYFSSPSPGNNCAYGSLSAEIPPTAESSK